MSKIHFALISILTLLALSFVNAYAIRVNYTEYTSTSFIGEVLKIDELSTNTSYVDRRLSGGPGNLTYVEALRLSTDGTFNSLKVTDYEGVELYGKEMYATYLGAAFGTFYWAEGLEGLTEVSFTNNTAAFAMKNNFEGILAAGVHIDRPELEAYVYEKYVGKGSYEKQMQLTVEPVIMLPPATPPL